MVQLINCISSRFYLFVCFFFVSSLPRSIFFCMPYWFSLIVFYFYFLILFLYLIECAQMWIGYRRFYPSGNNLIKFNWQSYFLFRLKFVSVCVCPFTWDDRKMSACSVPIGLDIFFYLELCDYNEERESTKHFHCVVSVKTKTNR